MLFARVVVSMLGLKVLSVKYGFRNSIKYQDVQAASRLVTRGLPTLNDSRREYTTAKP